MLRGVKGTGRILLIRFVSRYMTTLELFRHVLAPNLFCNHCDIILFRPLLWYRIFTYIYKKKEDEQLGERKEMTKWSVNNNHRVADKKKIKKWERTETAAMGETPNYKKKNFYSRKRWIALWQGGHYRAHFSKKRKRQKKKWLRLLHIAYHAPFIP